MSNSARGSRSRLLASSLGAGALLIGLTSWAHAEAWLEVGDAGLRHDIQYLVDTRVIDVPLTAWPIPAADVAFALKRVEQRDSLTPAQLVALMRVERTLDVTQVGMEGKGWLRGASKPLQLRSFEDTPREDAEAGASVSAANQRFSVKLAAQLVSDPVDDQELRLDGSYATLRLGNWLLTAGTLDRWWGPGWEGSLLLSSNARPVPALSLDRESSEPFRSPLLSWIGPWRLSAFMGAMEEHRADRDHPLLFGMRINFRPFSNVRVGSVKPLAGIEFALERTAQFCAAGLPCNPDAFWNVLSGHDNAGETVDPKEEPGNQLAGWSLRWASPFRQVPLAFYRQKTGETIDLHSPFPRRTLDLYGAEAWGALGEFTWRLHAEYADTACSARAGESEPAFDCAYTNGLFPVEGYRYRGRPIGYSADGDAIVRSAGIRLVSPYSWDAALLVRTGELNRGGAVPDVINTVASEPTDLREVEASLSGAWGRGQWRLGAGVEEQEQISTGRKERAARGFLEWRQDF